MLTSDEIHFPFLARGRITSRKINKKLRPKLAELLDSAHEAFLLGGELRSKKKDTDELTVLLDFGSHLVFVVDAPETDEFSAVHRRIKICDDGLVLLGEYFRRLEGVLKNKDEIVSHEKRRRGRPTKYGADAAERVKKLHETMSIRAIAAQEGMACRTVQKLLKS